MNNLLEVFFYLQSINTVFSIGMNGFLVYLVTYRTRSDIGLYKWIIGAFAVFEALYSIIILAGMPVHFVADGSWLVFNHGGLIGNAEYSFLGPALYCTFYEIWILFIVLHFLYRYVVVCHQNLVSSLRDSPLMRHCLVLVLVVFVAMTFVCGLVLCRTQTISETLLAKVQDQFQVEKTEQLGYILLKPKSADGEFSFLGSTTIFNHYLLVSCSSVIILFCSIKIWNKIQSMKRICECGKEVRLQHQMFLSLLVQTAVPVVFCHIPSVVYLSFPFWQRDFSFGVSSLIFTWVTSVNKFVDPFINILLIKDYRRAAKKILCGRSSQVGQGTSTGSRNVIS